MQLTSSKSNEIERLKKLLPNDLLSRVSIAISTETQASLMLTKKLDRDRFVIQLDPNYLKIETDYRNLLFWHEVARIQQHSVRFDRWEKIIFTAGLSMSMLEIFSQNVLLLAIYLLLTAIAGWQLYQSNRGENYFKQGTKADRGAILLATEFGYSLPKAYSSLHKALKISSAQAPKSHLLKEYQTRLQVLEISSIAQNII
jgi:Protein of unknown function (DUF3318)